MHGPFLLGFSRLRPARLNTTVYVVTKGNAADGRTAGEDACPVTFKVFKLCTLPFSRMLSAFTAKREALASISGAFSEIFQGGDTDLLIGKLDKLHRRAVEYAPR